MKKKVLILCTGNSCRSIMAEALLNAYLSDCLEAFSAGVRANGKVNENAKRLLEQHGIWKDSYYSKTIDEVISIDFDLVVTVCDSAKESCPTFPKKTEKLHISFEDPDGKDFSVFIETFENIKEKLLPAIKEKLCGKK